jgi:hypothetical protein
MTDLEFSVLAWSLRNPGATMALLAGRAAVVPLNHLGEIEIEDAGVVGYWGKPVGRLDKPVEC